MANEKTRQDRAAAAPEETKRAPGRKDRKRWCGGHVGREHQEVVAIPPNNPGWRKPCHEVPDWYRKTRAFAQRPQDWWCLHETMCTVCGRRRGRIPWRECPDRPKGEERQQ